MKFMVRINLSILIVSLLVACNNQNDVQKQLIELAYCLHVEGGSCKNERIDDYLRFFSSENLQIKTEKSADINNLCLLIERYDKQENEPLDKKYRTNLLDKLGRKMEGTKYNYLFYKDCRQFFDLQFVNPRNG
ncbi:hypothetical protein [uncultured Shewanella sp.]|uniref:hypothetical protein n=1 Tax=uncultured Shewanella sp. TaxID=173975 RepID=UPI0026078F81|nr:hypothetical protein [uncultured Shewanella sp.]